jgi:hypothetical protein
MHSTTLNLTTLIVMLGSVSMCVCLKCFVHNEVTKSWSPDTVHNTPRHNIGKLLEHIQQETQQK